MVENLTVRVETKPLIEQRAGAAGKSMGAYLDELVRADDLGERIRADTMTLVEAGYHTPERDERNLRLAALLRTSR